jgi:glutamate-5-semialdehyde dehydrogenase
MAHALRPSLDAAGLPAAAVQLLASRTHAAGWALFADSRLGLAVARGSGATVAQLGAVARQHGVAASLHGTGGAWMVLADDADPSIVEQAVLHSLDRKVCNTLNVCCVAESAAHVLLPCVVSAAEKAAASRGTRPVLHATASAMRFVDRAAVQLVADDELGTEWEWVDAPELSLVVVPDVARAVVLFNAHSPRFIASLVGGDEAMQTDFYESIDAPFVGDGFTRWVDGQFAFDQPELGLSNWQSGRLLARGGVLSGDSVYTVRTRAHVTDHTVHR